MVQLISLNFRCPNLFDVDVIDNFHRFEHFFDTYYILRSLSIKSEIIDLETIDWSKKQILNELLQSKWKKATMRPISWKKGELVKTETFSVADLIIIVLILISHWCNPSMNFEWDWCTTSFTKSFIKAKK